MGESIGHNIERAAFSAVISKAVKNVNQDRAKYMIKYMDLAEKALKGQWKQLKGEIRKQWGKLTDDEVDQINGEFEKLVGRIQERYGRSREEAQAEIEDYLARYSTTPS